MTQSLAEELSDPGPTTLARFLHEWFGIERQQDPTPRPAGQFPEALLDWYWRVGSPPPFQTQNDLLGPDEVWFDGDVLVFYVENQGVYLWGIPELAGDPAVVGRINDPNEPWEREGEPLSRFLLQVAMYEGSGPHGAMATYISNAEAKAALARLYPCGVEPWRWPAWPTRFYAGQDVLAITFPNGESGDETMLTVALEAKSAEALSFVEPFVTPEWEYFSLRDGTRQPG